jgi:hypothetical protein
VNARVEKVQAKKKLVLLAVGIGVIALLQVGTATGSHVRPKGATPISDALVPAQKACSAPNVMHGPSLNLPSCNPPAPMSQFLHVGTPDVNGAQANNIGRV